MEKFRDCEATAEPDYALAEPGSSVVSHPKRWVRDIQNHLGGFATKAGEKSGLRVGSEITS